MARWVSGILFLLCGGLALALGVQRTTISVLRDEVGQMRARVERVESRQRETATAKAALEELQEQVGRVEKKVAAAPPPASAPAAGAKADSLPTFVTEDDIQKIVEEKVEAKLLAKGTSGGGKGGGGGDRKMPLHDMGKELNLDPATQERVAEVANTTKKEIFELLKMPRPDGGNYADDLIDVFLGGDTAKAQGFFVKLMNDKVPGTDTTYITAVGNIQEKANEGLQKLMGPDAFGRYKHMNLKPENIETGFDPFGEYWKQRKQ